MFCQNAKSKPDISFLIIRNLKGGYSISTILERSQIFEHLQNSFVTFTWRRITINSSYSKPLGYPAQILKPNILTRISRLPVWNCLQDTHPDVTISSQDQLNDFSTSPYTKNDSIGLQTSLNVFAQRCSSSVNVKTKWTQSTLKLLFPAPCCIPVANTSVQRHSVTRKS